MVTKYFKSPFASAGDKTAIPTTPPPGGQVSYDSGFGIDYQLDPVTDPAALNIPRLEFNELMYQITNALQQYQQIGFPNFITTSDNGGTPFAYEMGATVRYDDGSGAKNYYSLVGANTALPTDTTKWGLVSYQTQIATGIGQDFWGATLPSGYVWANGQTIGNASSGATGRANADTAALFTLLWESFTNTVLPIQDSAGAASTRGVSAAADYAANKRLPTPDKRGRVAAGKDDMGGASAAGRLTNAGSGIGGDTLGASGGAQNVALTGNQNGAHTHAGSTDSAGSHAHSQITLPATEDDNPDPPLNQSVIGNNLAGSPATYTTNAGTNSAGAHTHNLTTSSSGLGDAHQNTQPTIVCNHIIKL